MALLDLALVTRTLVRLINTQVTGSPEWPRESGTNDPIALNVSPIPPDSLEGDSMLGIYLYHLGEHPQFKNLPAQEDINAPVQFTPMGLNLYYVLSAFSELGDKSEAAYREQLMMSLAVKAMHDYPILTDSVMINNASVFDDRLLGGKNRFEIALQPLPQNEAVNYWTAGSSPMRLSAYYEVSVVLLEPESIERRPGRVLSYGTHIFTKQTPCLETSTNTFSFTIPGEAEPREVTSRPAQVSVDNRVSFIGGGLSSDGTTLFIRGGRWQDPTEIEAAWDMVVTENEVSVDVQPTLAGDQVLPGTYTARVQVTTQKIMPDGSSRDFLRLSNETPFMITPGIFSIGSPDGDMNRILNGYIFIDPTEVLNIELIIGNDQLEQRPATAPSLEWGQFRVIDETSLLFKQPSGLTTGEEISVRLIVNGAEAPPMWMTV